MTKYKAKPVVVDNIRFHSTKEARRYQELRLLEKAGEITGLALQPKWSLDVKSVRIGHAIMDFVYIENGKVVVEDCKGFDTPMSRWKRRHMKAQYGIEVLTT